MGMSLPERRQFEADVARLCRLVSLTPRWRPGEVDGEPVMLDVFGDVAVSFHGSWASALYRFYNHFDHDALVTLLGLIEATPGTSAEVHARRFLEMLHLGDGRADSDHSPAS
ncbi:hypothetical protein AB0A74_06980 [Saccharothrix sp. NPDC042600]|uniref:hypothetical protein n=1 Tax=Saccharothrix TaxID=2071 RepID=UPI00340C0707|nr:hypothetical protein GCM10017745_30820 [Saccharothrix mutabilis subsp. capreolus]